MPRSIELSRALDNLQDVIFRTSDHYLLNDRIDGDPDDAIAEACRHYLDTKAECERAHMHCEDRGAVEPNRLNEEELFYLGCSRLGSRTLKAEAAQECQP